MGYHVSAVDDTKVHRYSPEVWGTCTFHEYTARCPNRAPTVRAHNWVVLGALLDNPGQPPWCLPLSGRLYFRKSQLPLQSQDSDHTVVFRTKCELVVELIREQARITGGRHLGIFDGAYALRSVVRPLVQPAPGHPRIEFLTRLRPDARLYALPPPGCRANQKWGRRLPPPPSGGMVVGTVAGGRRLHLWSAAAGPLEGTGVPVVGRRCGSAGQAGFLQYAAATYCSTAIYRFACAAWHQDLALGRRDLAWPTAPSAARRPRPRGRLCRRCPGPRCAAETACRLAQLPPSAGSPDLGSHRPTRSCDRPWLAGPPVPGAAPALVGFSPIPDSTAFTNRECQRYGPIDLFQKGPCQADSFSCACRIPPRCVSG